MADVHTKEQRSYNMSRIKSIRTKPELKLKKLFRSLGFVYQSKMFGKPDFAKIKEKTAIFIDGCFWHGCPVHYKAPKSNRKYWIPKIQKNVLRDQEVSLAYKNSGWKVVRIWECKMSKG